MTEYLIPSTDSLLLVIDIQERLWPHIANKDEVLQHSLMLMQAAEKMHLPTVISEQYPRGLGPTLTQINEAATEDTVVFEKVSFGCMGDSALVERIKNSGKQWLIVCGIETHVCVMQTVLEALKMEMKVALVADAVGSRVETNRQLAIERMRSAGATIVSTEMLLFEWMKTSKHPAFKEISKMVK